MEFPEIEDLEDFKPGVYRYDYLDCVEYLTQDSSFIANFLDSYRVVYENFERTEIVGLSVRGLKNLKNVTAFLGLRIDEDSFVDLWNAAGIVIFSFPTECYISSKKDETEAKYASDISRLLEESKSFKIED